MSLLILMRHGQSMWNAAKLFTGWVDVPLTNVGIEEAIAGGKQIAHLDIDEVHVSTLIRAQMTAMLALAQHNGGKTPVFQYPLPEAGVDSVSENEARMIEWAQIKGDAGSADLLPVHVSWQLNERMYGDLQGLNKDATRRQYGEETSLRCHGVPILCRTMHRPSVGQLEPQGKALLLHSTLQYA